MSAQESAEILGISFEFKDSTAILLKIIRSTVDFKSSIRTFSTSASNPQIPLETYAES